MTQSFPPLNISAALATATAHHQAGRLVQAEQLYRQILQQQPQHVEALNLLGVVACQNGKYGEGIALYRQALELKPSYTGARENLCLALWKWGTQLIEESINTYSQIVTFEPQNIQAYDNLGNILHDQNKLDEALSYYQQALGVQPDNARILNGMGIILQQQGKTKRSIYYHQRAVTLQPNYVEAHIGMGTALQAEGRFAEAAACLDRALGLAPNHSNARYNRAILHLIEGEYKTGFTYYEDRFKAGEFPQCPFTQPMWDGSDLNGRTLLLHAEQGMGDTLQFIRYAAIAAQKGGRLILTCHKPLMRLIGASFPAIERMVPLGFPVGDFQTYTPLLSLPHILGTTLETVPNQVPYLHPPQDSTIKLTAPAGTRLKVGIVWSGGHLYKHNHSRSCPLQYFEPLLRIPHVAYYSLQKGIPELDLQELGWQAQVQDLSNQLRDMAETAAAIAQLDLVITVDTSVAHLAGALGKPVWTLLSFLPDWRWMRQREDTPWYPTMRLFRQEKLDNWVGVMERVEQALREMVA